MIVVFNGHRGPFIFALRARQPILFFCAILVVFAMRPRQNGDFQSMGVQIKTTRRKISRGSSLNDWWMSFCFKPSSLSAQEVANLWLS